MIQKIALQDAAYKEAGATLVGAKEAFEADIVLKVRPPVVDAETNLFKPGSGSVPQWSQEAAPFSPLIHVPQQQ